MRRVASAALALLVALLTAAGPAAAQDQPTPPATGSIGVRLLDAPTNRRDDPRALTYVVDHLAPGTTITRHIEVSNSTAGPEDVAVYPGAATIAGGSFTGGDGHAVNDLTTWTHLSSGSVDLPAGGSKDVTVTIAVPADASAGERYGVVWAELASTAPPGSVSVVNRVGIRIYLSVGPGGEPASAMTVDTLTAERAADGTPVVRAQVHNTGGRALDISGQLALSNGPGGLSGGPFPVELGTTLGIGDTEAVTVPLDGRLPDGPWLATVDLHSGLLTAHAEATISFPDGAGTSGPAVVATSGGSGTPWVLVAGGAAAAVAVVLAVLVLVLRRRRRTTRPA